MNYKDIIEPSRIVELAKNAGDLIMKFYKSEDLFIERKADSSPVTEADHASSELIIKHLQNISTEIPVISEESSERSNLDILKSADVFWLIDPIDGTWSFMRGKGEFTVNIALVERGNPVFGVIFSPLTNDAYFDDLEGNAYKDEDGKLLKLAPRTEFAEGYDFLVSHQNLNQRMQDFIAGYQVKTITPVPSSIKFGLMSEGKGDIYPRFKPTCIWDTAAGHSIIKTLGGEIYDTNKNPLKYNIQLENPDFVAVINKSIAIK